MHISQGSLSINGAWAIDFARLEFTCKEISLVVILHAFETIVSWGWSADYAIKSFLSIVSVIYAVRNYAHVIAVYVLYQNFSIFGSASEL